LLETLNSMLVDLLLSLLHGTLSRIWRLSERRPSGRRLRFSLM
jgi:hypothetical protein